jgi:hypothetical protein
MRGSIRASTALKLLATYCVMHSIFTDEALGYIDPGTTGLLSQILYVLFYGALGIFFYYLRNIKQSSARAIRFLSGLLRRWV